MSFGFSPSDVVKLLEISTRVYIAFKDANENSEAQVESLVREFQAFAQCLLELDKLMKEFGRPMPFPVDDFKQTLDKCEASLKPYKENLVDRRMGLSKIIWTIKYIGKEKELEGLRKQITGHYQALNMCLSFLQLRLNLESSRRDQRLLLERRHRAVSLAGQWYTTDAIGAASQSSPSSPLALPAPDDAHPLYKDWEMFNHWLKSEDERTGQDLELARPSSWGDTPAVAPNGDPELGAVLYRLRCEVEDAIFFEKNRATRMAMEKRSHLTPSDAMKQQVKEMPPAPRQRINTLETNASSSYNPFESHPSMSDSLRTIRPGPSTPSPKTSPSASPQIEQEYFDPSRWAHSPATASMSHNVARSSVSTTRSSLSIPPDAHFSPSLGLGISTAHTTPDNALSSTMRRMLSTSSLVPIALGDSAMGWTLLCRKVQVERKSVKSGNGKDRAVIEKQECDVFWSHRADGGMSLCSSYRPEGRGKAKTWVMQDFPPLGPSIPLTTTIDGEVSIDFPRGSFGRLSKQMTDIGYTFGNSDSAAVFQTLLYTNNGKDAAELMFDRPMKTISSDKHRPECRGRNLRLWRKTEMRHESDEPVSVDVLTLLFYTSCLEEKGHWVEEPHYAFEWLNGSVYKKESDKLTLAFSKDAAKWTPDKLYAGRKASWGSTSSEVPTSPSNASQRRDSMEIPAIRRSGTGNSTSSVAGSIMSTRSFFGRSKRPASTGTTNACGYSKLELEFQSSKDRRAFLDVWKRYVRPLGG